MHYESIHTRLDVCRLCEGNSMIQVLQLAPTPAGDRYMAKEKSPEKLPLFPLDLNQCENCGHVQLGGIVDPSYLYRDYIYTTNSSLGLADHFAKYAASTIKRLSLERGSFVVEIGSNDGTMLEAFKNLGMRVLGIDPAREIAKKATESGVQTIPEFFSEQVVSDILSEHGHADLVIANNVMANVSNVRSIVEAVRQLLAANGVFVFETGYLKYLAEDVVFDNIYHEHIDYYSICPLQKFFHSVGMELFDVVETKSKGSSIRCFIGHIDKFRTVSNEVLGLAERERSLGYHSPLPYQRLGELLERTKTELHLLLGRYVSQGIEIYGFGASVGVTTILYKFGLNRYIRYLVDDNPMRDGLLSPGMGIPVFLADQAMEKIEKGAVVLLAWRYEEKILAHHMKKNIDFIRFFPVVESIIN